jgi:hypothetical protein
MSNRQSDSSKLHLLSSPSTYSYRSSPHPPIPGRKGGDLQKEGVWHIEAVGVVSFWS